MSQVKPNVVTITYGMRGFFVVCLSWDPDHGGFYSPEYSGFGSYADPADAEQEALMTAKCEGCEFERPNYDALVLSMERGLARSRRIQELRRAGMDVREAWRATKDMFK